MSELSDPPAAAASHPKWNADGVFEALADRTRRNILQLLADGQPRTAAVLARNVGKQLDATLKHLTTLRKHGIVQIVGKEGHRQLYAVSPQLEVTKADTGWELEFGCCRVRG